MRRRLRPGSSGSRDAPETRAGTVEGDPLNLVDRRRPRHYSGMPRAWDETESITFGTSWKTARAFLLESQYRYSPVSPLYLYGRQQDFALQRARAQPQSAPASAPVGDRCALRWTTGLDRPGQPRYRRALHAQNLEPHHSSDRSQCRRSPATTCSTICSRRAAYRATRLRRRRASRTGSLAAPQPDRRSIFHRRPARRCHPLSHPHYA